MKNRCHLWRRLLVAQAVMGCVLAMPTSVSAAEVIKSSVDHRSYAALVLGNGLRALVVSDPSTDKAAAALDVAVGSADDPAGREGLAHFLEHMLFLGTTKYPQAGDYRQFITTHGGSHNAYTDFEDTNYYFDIESQYLAAALDRFAQFFVAPLFSPEYVVREKQAVHAEYRSKLRSDWWRALDAKKQMVNPAHPFAKFSIGSLQTLADRPSGGVRDELVKFYRENYSADRMTLVVLGRESIPILKNWVAEKFSAVPRRVRRSPTMIKRPALFRPDDLPARIDIAPMGSRRSLSLVFPIPATRAYSYEKPVSYLASLIGHEGKGSLLSALKQVGWAFEVQAGLGVDHTSEATFNVSIELTESGKSRVEDIVALFFQYVELIKSKGIAEWIFEENRKIAATKFRFLDTLEPAFYARQLALNLQRYPVAEVVRAPYSIHRYDPDLILDYLRFLRPSNLLLTLLCDGVQTDSISPWFEAKYRIARIEEDEMERWRTAALTARLTLPPPNPFIPEDLSVKRVSRTTDAPELLQHSDEYELWYRQDDSYQTPRGDFYLTVRSPLANDSPAHAALAKLYVLAVKDGLTEFYYPARRAGLQYDLSHHVRGFSLRVSGFSDKQHLLVGRIIEGLKKPYIVKSKFDNIKTKLMRQLTDDKRRKPYRRSVSELPSLLIRPYWTDEEQIEALRAVTIEDLEAFVPQLLARISIVALAHGNWTAADAMVLGGLVEAGLWRGATPLGVPNGRVVKLMLGDELIRQVENNHPDSAVAVYFQGSQKSALVTAKFSLLRQIIAAPFYHELRTERQLGYVVFSALTPLLGTPGITFVVQSPTTDSGSLERHVDGFISSYEQTVALMSEDEFENHKSGLLTHILEAEQTLQERTDRYWDEINQLDYRFNSNERVAAAVRNITKQEFEDFYHNALLAGGRKRLTIRCLGAAHKAGERSLDLDVGRTVIEDRGLFAKNREYFSRLTLPPVVPKRVASAHVLVWG